MRVAGSADGATSRSLAAYFLSGSDHRRDGGDAVLGAADQRFGDRDHGFLFGKARDADRGLAGRHHLARLDQGRGDDAAGVGDERRIGQRVLGEFDRALGAIEARARFVGGGLGLVELRVGGPALGAQILGALLGGAGLRQHAGGGAEFGLGLLGLQFQIDFIEGRQRLADIDGLADLDQALGDLAGDPKAHVGFDPGLDGADEAALRRFRLVMHRATSTGRDGAAFSRDLVVAAGQRDGQQAPAIHQLKAWNSLLKSNGRTSDAPSAEPDEKCRLFTDECQYSSVIMIS